MIDSTGVLLGVVAAVDIEQALTRSQNGLDAHALLHKTPELRANQTLEDAIRALAATDDEGLPVLDTNGKIVVGWLTHRQLLHAYQARLDEYPITNMT